MATVWVVRGWNPLPPASTACDDDVRQSARARRASRPRARLRMLGAAGDVVLRWDKAPPIHLIKTGPHGVPPPPSSQPPLIPHAAASRECNLPALRASAAITDYTRETCGARCVKVPSLGSSYECLCQQRSRDRFVGSHGHGRAGRGVVHVPEHPSECTSRAHCEAGAFTMLFCVPTMPVVPGAVVADTLRQRLASEAAASARQRQRLRSLSDRCSHILPAPFSVSFLNFQAAPRAPGGSDWPLPLFDIKTEVRCRTLLRQASSLVVRITQHFAARSQEVHTNREPKDPYKTLTAKAQPRAFVYVHTLRVEP